LAGNATARFGAKHVLSCALNLRPGWETQPGLPVQMAVNLGPVLKFGCRATGEPCRGFPQCRTTMPHGIH